MKTILFLDDWMLDSKRNIARRFCNPELLAAELTLEGSAAGAEELAGQTSVYPNYLRDPAAAHTAAAAGRVRQRAALHFVDGGDGGRLAAVLHPRGHRRAR